MIDFTNQIIFPFIFYTNTLVEKANIAVGVNSMRMTFRFVNNSVNYDNDTNLIFVGQHNVQTLGLNSYDPSTYAEIMSPNITAVIYID